jgi:D-glycero-D-manno-heptose 1,7-bisphosphate phosphatase
MKCIVLDRDGTLIKYIPYLYQPELIELLPNVREVLCYFKDCGYKLFLHTNQSGVSRGYFQMSDVNRCNEKLIDLLDLGSDLFERICIAPDLESCSNNYRKPSSLFANEIISEYGILNSDLVYIGDNESDLQTALNIGCVGIGIISNSFRLDEFIYSNNGKKLFAYRSWLDIKNHFSNSLK